GAGPPLGRPAGAGGAAGRGDPRRLRALRLRRARGRPRSLPAGREPPTVSLAALDARLRQAAALMAQRRFAEARVLLEQLVLAEPRLAEARRLLGGALHALGDVAGAERELRQAVALARRSPAPHTALAELL